MSSSWLPPLILLLSAFERVAPGASLPAGRLTALAVSAVDEQLKALVALLTADSVPVAAAGVAVGPSSNYLEVKNTVQHYILIADHASV